MFTTYGGPTKFGQLSNSYITFVIKIFKLKKKKREKPISIFSVNFAASFFSTFFAQRIEILGRKKKLCKQKKLAKIEKKKELI